jgi:hypothetical protein
MTRARSLSQLANSNVFSVDANNSRVGIGSTIPDVKLDVGGDLYADNLTINNLIGVAATFSGVVTYEDVTNVDSIGIITARSYVSIADSIVHTGDTDTSIRFPAADTFTVETAGTERLRITSGGNVGIGTDNPGRVLHVKSSGSSVVSDFECDSTFFTSIDLTNTGGYARITSLNNDIILSPAGSEALRVDSSQRLLLGDTSVRAVGTIGPTESKINIETPNSISAGFNIVWNRSDDGLGPRIRLGKSRTATVGGSTVVESGDELGTIEFCGADGTDLTNLGASIAGLVDGTPGGNDMPGRLVFATSADGSGAPTERMRIDRSGTISLGNLATPANANIHLDLYCNSSYDAFIRFRDESGAPGLIGFDHGSNAMQFYTNGASAAMQIDSSGRLLIGTSSSGGAADSSLQIRNESGSNVELIRSTSDDNPCRLRFTKSRGSEASPTAVVAGDVLSAKFGFMVTMVVTTPIIAL